MFSYTYDEVSGGIILNSTPTGFSKEPRPVFAKEMDLLGFDTIWEYDSTVTDIPYMWAESNMYWYRAKNIARLRGGDLYHAPELIPVCDEDGNALFSRSVGDVLTPVDMDGMLYHPNNLAQLSVLEDTTTKKIVKEYEKRKNLDLFHVAFSGGKDSTALLHLVENALPDKRFVVIFGDTRMEFPDTYALVERERVRCESKGIPFYIARSHFEPNESWKLFGPPSKTLRWCCSVHKSTPQTTTMREICGLMGKNDYTGLDFVGVRKHESAARSEYEYENFSKKQKGQFSYNPILEWTSAEVWLYILSNHFYLNEAYKKGNSRAGCLLCPMSSGTSDYIRRYNYTEKIDDLIRIIQDSNEWDSHNKADTLSYVTSGGWINRRSGRGIAGNFLKCRETVKGDNICFELISPSSDWREWIKTAESHHFPYSAQTTPDHIIITVSAAAFKRYPSEGRIFRQALRKAAYCVGCKVCETNCKFDRLHFENGKIVITDCVKCHKCHDIPAGCHAYNSLKIPQGEKKLKTINCFDDHAP